MTYNTIAKISALLAVTYAIYLGVLTYEDSGASSAESYDYVIVGAGTAGSIIAARLAEQGYSVQVLEAGRASQAILGGELWALEAPKCSGLSGLLTQFDVPNFYHVFLANSDVLDQFFWKGEVNVRKTSRKDIAGKLAGGSAAINAMWFIRGVPSDFDEFFPETWKWDDVLPYYQKIENYTDISAESDSYRGSSGRIQVMTPPLQLNINDHFSVYIEAFSKLGVPFMKDVNAPDRYGVGYYQSNIADGVRRSSAFSYLPVGLETGNLDVHFNAQATKIDLDSNNRARGVFYRQGDEEKHVAAKKVILSAGTLNTPKLLILSGIGAPETLKKINVTAKVESLGVGNQLNDHLGFGMSFEYNDMAPKDPSSLYNFPDAFNEYSNSCSGPLSIRDNKLFATLSSHGNTSRPNIYLNLCPSGVQGDQQTYFIGVNLGLSTTRGYLDIKTSDPFAPLGVKFDDITEEDIDSLAWGVEFMRNFSKTEPLASITAGELIPGPEYTGPALRQWILDNIMSNTHFASGAPMGADDDPMAVVDAKLRVKGARNLYVADASVLPISTHGNIQATVYMVGERAAELIANDKN